MVGWSNGQRDIGIPKPETHGHQTRWLKPCVILSASYHVLVPQDVDLSTSNHTKTRVFIMSKGA